MVKLSTTTQSSKLGKEKNISISETNHERETPLAELECRSIENLSQTEGSEESSDLKPQEDIAAEEVTWKETAPPIDDTAEQVKVETSDEQYVDNCGGEEEVIELEGNSETVDFASSKDESGCHRQSAVEETELQETPTSGEETTIVGNPNEMTRHQVDRNLSSIPEESEEISADLTKNPENYGMMFLIIFSRFIFSTSFRHPMKLEGK